MRTSSCLMAAVLLVAGGARAAVALELDTEFGQGGVVDLFALLGVGPNHYGYAPMVIDDGAHLVVSMSVHDENGENAAHVAQRLTYDGAIDPTFALDASLGVPAGYQSNVARIMAATSSGYLFHMLLDTPSGGTQGALCPLGPSGALAGSCVDFSYTIPNPWVGDSYPWYTTGLLDASGRFLIDSKQWGGGSPGRVLRMSKTGAVDASFGSGGTVTKNDIWSQTLSRRPLPDGGFMLLGYGDGWPAKSWCSASRYGKDGALRTEFAAGGGVVLEVSPPATLDCFDVREDATGAIWLAYARRQRETNDAPMMHCVARFLPSGAIDASYGDAGSACQLIATSVASIGFGGYLAPRGDGGWDLLAGHAIAGYKYQTTITHFDAAGGAQAGPSFDTTLLSGYSTSSWVERGDKLDVIDYQGRLFQFNL